MEENKSKIPSIIQYFRFIKNIIRHYTECSEYIHAERVRRIDFRGEINAKVDILQRFLGAFIKL